MSEDAKTKIRALQDETRTANALFMEHAERLRLMLEDPLLPESDKLLLRIELTALVDAEVKAVEKNGRK